MGELTEEEIAAVFEKLGIGTEADRNRMLNQGKTYLIEEHREEIPVRQTDNTREEEGIENGNM